MPGPLLHDGATVLCSHAGQASPASPNARVQVSNQPTATMPIPWTVAGCPGIPPNVPPCVVGQWMSGTTRVLSGGMPLLIADSQGLGTPPATPLMPVSMQTRVIAT